MIEIHALAGDDALWETAADYAEKCSWRAGKTLSNKMKSRSFLPWERVFTAVENEKILGYCTLCENDELAGDYNFTPFIGFVFVDERARGNRLSERLLACACNYAKKQGYERIYIMSGEKGLYEKYGFTPLGGYRTIYGTIDTLFVKPLL